MGKQFHIRVGQKKICHSKAATQVREFVLTVDKFVVQIVWDEALDESFEEGVDTGQVKLGFGLPILFWNLPELVAKIFYALCLQTELPRSMIDGFYI